ncbi:MAG: ribbon-helix-helix protein, CopG family [Nitrospirae bacterium]|nr:ribbon-helix-helix protein, CopG family [Nitrospirota bacterium]
MPVSVRLDNETEELLEKTARFLSKSKSKIMKDSIKDYCSRIAPRKKYSPYELAKDLIGKEGSGRRDLSIRGEEILRELFRRKRLDRT